MQKHTCKHCNHIFEYCRGCFLSPIPHMDAGFCSKECYEASKNKVEPMVEIEPVAEEVVIEETVATVSNEEIVPTEVEIEPVVEQETLVDVETTEIAKPIIKNETYNAYKKKKNKHR